MTLESDWLAIQRGCDFNQECLPATTRVFMRNGRDLAQFVHVDNVYYGPFNACLLLISGADPLRRCEASAGFGAPFADGIPYVNPFSNTQLFPPSGFQSKNQIGITTFGPNHLKSLVLEVMNRALRAVWYQKWAVHRRLRPEAFAGRIHFHLTQPANPLVAYPFDMPELTKLGSTSQAGSLLDRIFAHNTAQNNASGTGTNPGTYLLPIAYAEGSPLHPSYGQGHATAAGAAVTILKAFFKDVSFADLNQRVLEVKANGMTGNFQGSGSSTIDQITTVHGELNKLASNIGIARNIAGVHYRSDYINSVLLGEQVAINLLDDLYSTFNEKFTFRFRLFNGSEYVLNKSESGPDLNRN
jgi:membrane-associated phospholipid phosphatase